MDELYLIKFVTDIGVSLDALRDKKGESTFYYYEVSWFLIGNKWYFKEKSRKSGKKMLIC